MSPKTENLLRQMSADAQSLSLPSLWSTIDYLDRVAKRDTHIHGKCGKLTQAAIKIYGDELQFRLLGTYPQN